MKTLDLLGNIVALKTAGAKLKGYSSPLDFSLYLYQIGFPGAAAMIFCMANLVSSYRVFSANIASP
jgi:hypothetical protein